MAEKATKKDAPEKPPLALVTTRSGFNALAGTIEERIRAFDQIAANLASLQLNGWNDVQKVKAGCWLADGAGIHPAIFMQNHYCMNIDGRLMVEPKWEFIVGILQSRIPGFRFKVLIETDDCAKVWMHNGRDEHTVEYTVQDATRQGLMGRTNAWKGGNTREMCLKQAIKRCGRRVGAAALMDLPIGLDGFESESAPQPPAPVEAAVEAAIENALGSFAEEIPADAERGSEGAAPSPTPAAPPVDPLKVLSAIMVRMYGKQTAAVALEKAATIYNEMMKERTGVDPKKRFRQSKEIGPVEAEQMIEYLKTRPAGAAPGEAVQTSAQPRSEGSGLPSPDDDVPPPAELPTSGEADPQTDYDDLLVAVKRARDLFKRKFVTEAPHGSGKMWFIDDETFRKAGKTASIKIMDQGEIVIDQMLSQQLTRLLTEACDEAERGR